MSAQTDLVHQYLEGFRRSDHEVVLACLNDVAGHIHGHRTTHGKSEFDGEIENAFEGSPELTVERVFEDGDVVVVTGEGPRAAPRRRAVPLRRQRPVHVHRRPHRPGRLLRGPLG
jgi:hypothetical protein